MPIAVAEVLIFTLSLAMLIAAVWILLYPDAAVRHLSEPNELTHVETKKSIRVTAVVLLFFACAGFHLVFVHGVKPFPPGENGVGF